MVHAALLPLMLEAVDTDLVFTISLKRSTQNLQLSTSSPADYPIFNPESRHDGATLTSVKNAVLRRTVEWTGSHCECSTVAPEENAMMMKLFATLAAAALA